MKVCYLRRDGGDSPVVAYVQPVEGAKCGDAGRDRGELVVEEVEGVDGGSPGLPRDGGEVIVGEVQGGKGWGPVGY